MERNIPVIGWIVIGCLVSLVILLNFSLWSAWKRKNTNNSLDILKKSGQMLRQPWQKEDEQLEKLSREAEKLRRGKTDPPEESKHLQN